MPKVTIEIDFKGLGDVEMQKPVSFMLKQHSTYLAENSAPPQGEQEFQVYNAVLKWKVEQCCFKVESGKVRNDNV